MEVFAGTERQCTEDEHDDEDENDSQISEFGFKEGQSGDALPTGGDAAPRKSLGMFLSSPL